jgi:hypothetical protein
MSQPERNFALSRLGLAVLIAIVLVAVAAGFYFEFLPGLSVARQQPSNLETEVATYLLRHSVPASAKAMVNPLGTHPEAAAIAADVTCSRKSARPVTPMTAAAAPKSAATPFRVCPPCARSRSP